jgi:methylthioribose-1-phosphate isomerase
VIPHPAPLSQATYSAVELALDDSEVLMLDQRRLPDIEEYHRLRTATDVARAIADMVVRGAPAIGISAAYGIVLAAREGRALEEAGKELAAARPTAVNLFWAIDRMLAGARALGGDPRDHVAELAEAARAIHREDVGACRAIGALGAERITDGDTVLTHCNAGALATGGYGTALGVIRAAHEAGKRVRVLADETRPYLQGARLTAWELVQLGIEVEVIADSAAASYFGRGEIALAVVGADRIARNGDVANKIGTYGVACLCRAHERPLYVAAPWSTVDVSCATASDVVIEERSAAEITHFGERRLVPLGAGVRNPAFDVTPARLVRAIFTDRGAIEPVNEDGVVQLDGGRFEP